MDVLEGIWRLVDSRAWDELGTSLAAPYGQQPMGAITFRNGRMLAALCNGDATSGGSTGREFSSYGGPYTFDGETLEVVVDIASDPQRIGGSQARAVVMLGERMVLRPPARGYREGKQQRELLWERVWCPGEEETVRAGDARSAAAWDAPPQPD